MVVATGTETVGFVQQFVERTGQLYSLPAAAAEILRLTGEPQIDPQAIKKCLENDPALAARILRVVNSSLFGPTRPVTDLNQALTLLGIRPLKMLVLGFSLPKELFAGLEAESLAYYWRQTLIKAVAARELSERLWLIPGDEPFLAGLVQDIGSLALIQQLGPTYQNLLSHIRSHGGSLLEFELDTLGFDHLVLSARLLAHWGLPAGLCAAISIPPEERRVSELTASERTLPRILHLAHLISVLIEQPYGSALCDLLSIGSRYRNLTYETLQPVVSAVQTKVNELAEVLSLRLPNSTSYVDLLLCAHERLSGESIAGAIPLTANQPEGDLLRVVGDLRSEVQNCLGRSSRPATAATSFASFVEARAEERPAPQSSVESDFDPSLEAQVDLALTRSRQIRGPMSLAFVEVDAFDSLLMQIGPAGARDVLAALTAAINEWTDKRFRPILISDSRLAMLWEDCSRSEAVQLSRDLLSQLRVWPQGRTRTQSVKLTVSIGLATLDAVPKNYVSRQIIDAATSCLSSAKLSGGNTVKSIEV